jgi:hypothetical protein
MLRKDCPYHDRAWRAEIGFQEKAIAQRGWIGGRQHADRGWSSKRNAQPG